LPGDQRPPSEPFLRAINSGVETLAPSFCAKGPAGCVFPPVTNPLGFFRKLGFLRFEPRASIAATRLKKRPSFGGARPGSPPETAGSAPVQHRRRPDIINRPWGWGGVKSAKSFIRPIDMPPGRPNRNPSCPPLSAYCHNSPSESNSISQSLLDFNPMRGAKSLGDIARGASFFACKNVLLPLVVKTFPTCGCGKFEPAEGPPFEILGAGAHAESGH